MKKTTPINSPRDFRADEIFFSTTDSAGRILSSNEVFMRTSGYSWAEMEGHPHNIIRHPDMPRAAFRLVWDYLKRGKSVVAYVKNMACDGRYYWVVALLIPLKEGYLSVRFKPTSEIQAAVESLYSEMHGIEQAAADRGETPAAGMDLATEKMLAALQGLGFSDYDAFMPSMMHSELKSRDATIARNSWRLLPEWVATPGDNRHRAIYDRCHDTYQLLNRLYDELDQYEGLNRTMNAGFLTVAASASEFRLMSLNAIIKAAQLGDLGMCSGVIAAYLGDVSSRISDVSIELAGRMQPVAAGLRAAIFHLTAARLLLEMIMLFCYEMATAGPESIANSRNVADLQSAFDRTIKPAVEELSAAGDAMHGLRSHTEGFRQLTIAMQLAQISGAVEASRLVDEGSMAQTFRDVREQTEVTKTKLDGLVEVIAAFDRLSSAAPEIVKQITASSELTRIELREFLALLDAPAGIVDQEPSPRHAARGATKTRSTEA
jgi:aerotaxis receptor